MKEDGRERRGRAEEGMESTEEEKEEVREGVRPLPHEEKEKSALVLNADNASRPMH